MTTQREIQELFNKIAFPETPEERDDAEQAVGDLLAEAWEEGFQKGVEFCEWSGGLDDYKPDFTNPYTTEAQVDGL